MVKVVFECYENRNQLEEEFEFNDNVTDEEIEEEWKEWVWDQIKDDYGWVMKGGGHHTT